jgi:hypothetical protein
LLFRKWTLRGLDVLPLEARLRLFHAVKASALVAVRADHPYVLSCLDRWFPGCVRPVGTDRFEVVCGAV